MESRNEMALACCVSDSFARRMCSCKAERRSGTMSSASASVFGRCRVPAELPYALFGVSRHSCTISDARHLSYTGRCVSLNCLLWKEANCSTVHRPDLALKPQSSPETRHPAIFRACASLKRVSWSGIHTRSKATLRFVNRADC